MNLAWLKSSTRELQWLQYFKMVFLKIPNVPLRMVFTETVTYFANGDYNYTMHFLQTACTAIALTHIWIQSYKYNLLNNLNSNHDFIDHAVNCCYQFLTTGITTGLLLAPLFLCAGMTIINY